VAAASIVGGMRFLSIHQFAVVAYWYPCCTALFQVLIVQVTAPRPHTTGRMLAVRKDMAEFLAVVTMRETSLSFVHLYPDCNVAKACHFEYLMRL
jgi:hypothetical protein